MNKFITALIVALSLAITLPAHAWDVGKPEIDRLRGTVDIQTGHRAEDHLTWITVRCKNNVTTMSISYADSFFPNHSSVIYKINDGPVRTHFARVAASYDLLLITNPIPMIRHMLKGGNRGSMIIEYELEYYANVQTEIKLYDSNTPSKTFAKAMKPIQKACNWE